MAKLITKSGTLKCKHGGEVKAAEYSSKVKINGQGVAIQTKSYTVSGCSQVPPVGPTCMEAKWLKASTTITVGGDPILLDDSKAISTPPGDDVNIASAHGGSATVEGK